MLNSSSVSEAFLAELRERTGPSHQALESLPLSMALVDPGLTREQYVLYLQTMYGMIAEVEEKIFPVVSELVPDIESRRKKELLLKDMEKLGAPVPPAGDNLNMEAATDLAYAMGIMYVIEGSTLGGRVILKSIDKSLGLNAENGAAYFAGYGADTGMLWKLFLDSLMKFAAESERQPGIIEGAESAFNIIYQLMNQQTKGVDEN
jgi:heme oxygenase (biliverdin-IX-beta and delta-forming)